ncbi:osmotically-inducible lipoprotein OsmE [Zestomonas carbonaria]|uniref:Outer membrane protein assembly factor BamE domain-containing protein n=1 Tax=Zestomonas carbonaria TaxID=2762745 RepID=A0A7U7EKA6_9GAMM|nr:osmotically-inducible lipoprotein OsmE [Pseudomonas carbonaria]CAD5106592.1 hypothetical protein PSEWESI4_00857 [Pseudomonas carbonaria]
MSRLSFLGAGVLGCVAACTNLSSTYRDEPLVAQVHKGMSIEQVRQIGGEPLRTSPRNVSPGSCDDYRLSGVQPYHVAFDADGRVAARGFINCEAFERADYQRLHPVREGGY